MKTSQKLFVCFFDKSIGISKTIDAYLFKFGDDYKRFHNDILYFCNWANQPIDIKDGWNVYHSIQ